MFATTLMAAMMLGTPIPKDVERAKLLNKVFKKMVDSYGSQDVRVTQVALYAMADFDDDRVDVIIREALDSKNREIQLVAMYAASARGLEAEKVVKLAKEYSDLELTEVELNALYNFWRETARLPRKNIKQLVEFTKISLNPSPPFVEKLWVLYNLQELYAGDSSVTLQLCEILSSIDADSYEVYTDLIERLVSTLGSHKLNAAQISCLERFLDKRMPESVRTCAKYTLLKADKNNRSLYDTVLKDAKADLAEYNNLNLLMRLNITEESRNVLIDALAPDDMRRLHISIEIIKSVSEWPDQSQLYRDTIKGFIADKHVAVRQAAMMAMIKMDDANKADYQQMLAKSIVNESCETGFPLDNCYKLMQMMTDDECSSFLTRLLESTTHTTKVHYKVAVPRLVYFGIHDKPGLDAIATYLRSPRCLPFMNDVERTFVTLALRPKLLAPIMVEVIENLDGNDLFYLPRCVRLFNYLVK